MFRREGSLVPAAAAAVTRLTQFQELGVAHQPSIDETTLLEIELEPQLSVYLRATELFSSSPTLSAWPGLSLLIADNDSNSVCGGVRTVSLLKTRFLEGHQLSYTLARSTFFYNQATRYRTRMITGSLWCTGPV